MNTGIRSKRSPVFRLRNLSLCYIIDLGASRQLIQWPTMWSVQQSVRCSVCFPAVRNVRLATFSYQYVYHCDFISAHGIVFIGLT